LEKLKEKKIPPSAKQANLMGVNVKRPGQSCTKLHTASVTGSCKKSEQKKDKNKKNSHHVLCGSCELQRHSQNQVFEMGGAHGHQIRHYKDPQREVKKKSALFFAYVGNAKKG
jgi:hypothetical protein